MSTLTTVYSEAKLATYILYKRKITRGNEEQAGVISDKNLAMSSPHHIWKLKFG